VPKQAPIDEMVLPSQKFEIVDILYNAILCLISIPSPIILPYWRSVGLIIIPANSRLHLGYVEAFPACGQKCSQQQLNLNIRNKINKTLLSYTSASQEG
jgi:hypothetical protein